MAKSSQPDSDRIYHLYRYILGCLAIDRKSDQVPKAQKTAERVGDKDLRKLFPALFADAPAWEEAVAKHSKAKKITTGQVVNMLSELQKALEHDYKKHLEPYSRVLTTEDILIALYQLIELTPQERTKLGLTPGDGLTLLKQTLIALQTNGGLENYEVIFKAYKEAIGLNFSSSTAVIESLDQVDDLIETTVEIALEHLPERPAGQYFKKRASPSKADTVRVLSRKAQREIRRLLARSGNTQSFLQDSASQHHYIQNYLQPTFIQKFARTVVENERLTDQFPVYIKRVTVEACGPLPFADEDLGPLKSGSYYPSLLNQKLQQVDGNLTLQSPGDIPAPSDYELAAQGATKITLEFYIKVPIDYQNVVGETFEALVSSLSDTDNLYRRVDFTCSSTGIGGTLSHAIKVINNTLLFDIPCLCNFFSIAHDVTSTQTIIRDNVPSPVWAHSLVKLCYKEAVGQALWTFGEANSTYDTFSFGDPIGHGDFCGYDFSLAQIQASLQARLQAIRNTGINPREYVDQLCQKTERMLTLKQAWAYAMRYPFSSMAMIGLVHRTLLRSVFDQGDLQKKSQYIYFDAYLSIAEVLLAEGAYRASYQYIKRITKVLDPYVRDGLAAAENSVAIGIDKCEIFSGNLVIRYLISLAMYYYFYDIEAHCKHPLLPDDFPAELQRSHLIQRAWEKLALAQQHVEARLKKYIVIGEVSQGIFHPHYELLSKIYLTRAKLLIFFPRLVPEDQETLRTENFHRQPNAQQRTEASIHWGRLYLLEKARLYIAANGNNEAYAYYAAIQSCVYLMAACASPNKLTVPRFKKKGDRTPNNASNNASNNNPTSPQNSNLERTLDTKECLEWAEKLRNHALLAYADTGRQCYYAIKEKSGWPEEFDTYGHYKIEKIPPIFEFREQAPSKLAQSEDELLKLDMSLLAVDVKQIPKLTANHPTQTIYLFGTNACYLFLVRGLYLLCSDRTQEFEPAELGEVIDWPCKLSKALRLLDMAWAIAEDGCNIRKKAKKKERTITRSFQNSGTDTQYSSPEIDSVRDLYPRRVSEIADLGKVFSAACMVLSLHTLPVGERGELMRSLDKICNMLHGEYKLRSNTTLQALLSKQKRFNGHLQVPFRDMRAVLERYKPTTDTPYSDEALKARRDGLMKDLFAAFLK
jgi:hypothetical protein